MILQTIQIPTTRAEFERRFHLLREQFRQGRIHVPREITLGIGKVRFLPNGRIDFLSVNESARLQANMTIQFESEAFNAMAGNRKSQDTPEDSPPEYTGEGPVE